jgi:MarR family 2-MHQ and catechol resistance regulon transcriptional repressor
MKNLDIKESIPGVHVWLVLAKSARALGGYAERSIEELGMCASDFGALEILLHKGPLPVNEIGRSLLLTSGSMTTAVDRLEKRGLVRRESIAGDRRTRVVHLTPAGGRLIRSAFARHAADMERATAVLSPAERRTLIDLLKKLGRAEAVEKE